MKCPNCKLENPSEAIRCDCGYDFEAKVIKQSFVDQGITAAPTYLFVLGWIFSLLGGWLGIAISLYILNAKDKNIKTQYRFNKKSRNHAVKMVIVASVMFLVGLVYRALS